MPTGRRFKSGYGDTQILVEAQNYRGDTSARALGPSMLDLRTYARE